MSPADIDRLALAALRLLPDEPDRAMRLWDDAVARAHAAGRDRTLLRLRIVKMHHQARFGDREALGSQMLARSEEHTSELQSLV